MVATSLPPALARELADLRRRAYGPDADIGADPSALHRLHELEALCHATPADPPAGALPGSSSTERVDRTAHRRPSRRRRWIAASVLGATVAASLTAVFVVAADRPENTTMVATAAERQRLVDRVDLARIGMIGARLQPFADFGELWVWSATDSTGATCLLVGTGEDDALHVECAEASAPISLALRVGGQVRPALVGGLPEGSEVRFTMRDGSVSVAVETADG